MKYNALRTIWSQVAPRPPPQQRPRIFAGSLRLGTWWACWASGGRLFDACAIGKVYAAHFPAGGSLRPLQLLVGSPGIVPGAVVGLPRMLAALPAAFSQQLYPLACAWVLPQYGVSVPSPSLLPCFRRRRCCCCRRRRRCCTAAAAAPPLSLPPRRRRRAALAFALCAVCGVHWQLNGCAVPEMCAPMCLDVLRNTFSKRI